MDKKSLHVLKKLYQPTNAEYDFERNVSLYKEDLLTESEKDVLKELNWPVNQIQNGIHNS